MPNTGTHLPRLYPHTFTALSSYCFVKEKMTAICFCGICIPYSVILPFILFIFKPIWEFIKKFLVVKSDDNKTQSTNSEDKGCSEVTNVFADKNHLVYDSSIQWKSLIKRDLLIVRFTAPWCKPCKRMEEQFYSLAEKYKKHNFVTIDVDQSDSIAAECSVLGIPHFQVYQNGICVENLTGEKKIELQQLIEKYCEKIQ
jgi:thioredoxin 1